MTTTKRKVGSEGGRKNGRKEMERETERSYRKRKKRPADIAQLIEHLPRVHKALDSIPELYTLSMAW